MKRFQIAMVELQMEHSQRNFRYDMRKTIRKLFLILYKIKWYS